MSEPTLSEVQTDRPWDRLRGETDGAFKAFQAYLKLEKRGVTNPRRYTDDLIPILGVKGSAQLCRWAKAWFWTERADEYDRFVMPVPLDTQTELKARKEFVQRLHRTSESFFDLVDKHVAKLKEQELPMAPEDIARFAKLAKDLEAHAQKLEEPEVENKREQLVNDIRGLVDGLAGRLGKLAGGATGGTVTATERTVSFQFDGDGPPEGTTAIPAIPGEICVGASEAEMVVEADRDCPCDQGP